MPHQSESGWQGGSPDGQLAPWRGAPPARTPMVLTEWMAAWAEAVDHAHWELSTYIAGLDDEETTPRLETVRRWLVIDWLLRAAAPRWLRAAGLTDHAATLRSLAAAGSPAALVAAEPSIQAAARAAHQAHETAWYTLAQRAHPDAEDPDRARTWMAVVDGTQAAARCAWTLVEPAARATGYTTQPEGGPAAWHAALDAITNAAAAITWGAAQSTTSQAGWSWRAPPTAARALAYTAARSALAPTEAAVQGAVCELIHVMFSMASPSPAGGSGPPSGSTPARLNTGQQRGYQGGRPPGRASGRSPAGAPNGGGPRHQPRRY